MKRLRDYQLSILDWLKDKDYAALFWEMRLGKTLVTMRWIKQKHAQNVLVVAPYSALDGWRKESESERLGDINLLTGSKKQRIEKLKHSENCRINAINSEGFLSCPEIADIDWDFIVVDEAHYLKNPKSKITKFYTQNFSETKTKLALTGTPMFKSHLEYYCQMEFLNKRIINYPTYWSFRHSAFIPGGYGGYNWTIKSNEKKKLIKQLSSCCSFLTRKDIHIGRTKIYQTRNIRLSGLQKKSYEKLEKEWILETENGNFHTKSAGVLYQYSLRITGGWDPEGNLIGTAKQKELMYLLNTELHSQKLVIWCRFTHEINGVYNLLKEKNFNVQFIHGEIKHSERNLRIKNFQDGKTQILVLQPKCFKLGVDLSQAKTEIYYSQTDGTETRIQSEDRLVSAADSESVLVIDLVVENSVDEDTRVSQKIDKNKYAMFRRTVNRVKNKS